MTAEQGIEAAGNPAAPIEQITQLCAISTLVAQMAPDAAGAAVPPDEKVLAAAYRHAPSIARKRFEALADETAAIAGAGARALLDREGDISAAAAELQRLLQGNLAALAAMVGSKA